MATVATLIAKLTLDDSQFNRQLRTVESSLKGTAEVANRVGRRLTASLTAPLAAFSAAAVKVERDFTRTMTQVNTLAGESVEGVNRLSGALLKMAPAVGAGPGELAKALLVVESTGTTGAKALAIVESSAKASAVGLGEVATIARAVTAALNVYGDSGLTAAKATDQLLTAVKVGGAEAASFAGVLGTVIGIADDLGVSFAEVTGFIANFTRLGISAEEAATALRGAMSTLLKPTDETKQALKQLSTTVEQLRADIADRGLSVALIDLVLAAEQAGVDLSALVPNVRALAGVLGTAGAQAEAYAQNVRDIVDANGAVDDAFEATRKSGVRAFDELKASIEAFLIVFARDSGLVQLAQSAANAIKELTVSFTNLDPETKRNYATLSLMLGAVGPLAIALGTLASVIRLTLVPAIALAVSVLGPGSGLYAVIGVTLIAAGLLTKAFQVLSDEADKLSAPADAATQAYRNLGIELDEVRRKAADTLNVIEVQTDLSIVAKQIAATPVGNREQLEALLERRQELQNRLEQINRDLGPLEVGASITLTTEESERIRAQGGDFDAVGEAAGRATAAVRQWTEAQQEAIASAQVTVDALRLEAAKFQGQALAAGQSEEALLAFNREMFILEKTLPVVNKLMEEGIGGELLEQAAINARAAAAGIFDARQELERFEEAEREAIEAQRRAERDAARQAELTAEALAEPFKNAFRDMQTLFTDTFQGMLSGALSSWKDFWGQLKNIATRFAANLIATRLFNGLAASFAGSLGGVAVISGGASPAGAATGAVTGAAGPLGPAGGGSFFSSLSNTITGSISQAFKDLPKTVGNAFAGIVKSAGGGVGAQAKAGNIGVGVGTALQGIGGVLASIPIADKLIDKLNLSNNTKLEKIAQYAGGVVGGLIGSYLTGGSQLGGLIGGILGAGGAIGQAQVIQALKSGSKLFEAPNRLQAINRGAAIGGPIGALIGGLLFNKLDTNVDIQTRSTEEALRAIGLQGGGGAGPGFVRRSPFGFIGLAGAGTGGDVTREQQRNLLDTIAAIDSSIAQYLTRRERDLLAAANLSQYHSNIRNADKVITARIGNILSALGIPTDTASRVLVGSAEEQVTAAGDLLSARRDVVQLLEELRGTAEPATEAAAAIERVNRSLDEIAFSGPALGVVVDDIEELRTVALRRLVEAFDEAIADSILAFTDPLEATLKKLGEAQEERLREAEAFGADLVEVERLNALERARVLEDAFSPVDALLDQLRLGVGIQTPSEVAAQTEADFRAMASQVSAGLFVDPTELTSAAGLFLDASRAINASSVAFFEDLDLVRSILERSRANAEELPGFASGGDFSVPGFGRDNVVPLFRVSGSETVSVRTRAQRAERERALQNIADGIQEGNARATQTVEAIQSLEERMARHEAELIRLARAKVASR